MGFGGRHGDGWWLPKHSIERTLHWDDDSWQEPQMLPWLLFGMRIECELFESVYFAFERVKDHEKLRIWEFKKGGE